MALSELQRDLQGYAETKLYHLIKDTIQAFEIAGQRRDAMVCLCAMFLKAAAMIAAESKRPKAEFMRAAGAVFDHESERKESDNG
jgi:hypothetical protein